MRGTLAGGWRNKGSAFEVYLSHDLGQSHTGCHFYQIAQCTVTQDAKLSEENQVNTGGLYRGSSGSDTWPYRKESGLFHPGKGTPGQVRGLGK